MGAALFGHGIGQSEPDGRTPKLAGRRTWILERINAGPTATLAGLQDWLGGRGVVASVASILCFLRSCNITRRKLTPVANERDRPVGDLRQGRRREHNIAVETQKGLRLGSLRP